MFLKCLSFSDWIKNVMNLNWCGSVAFFLTICFEQNSMKYISIYYVLKAFRSECAHTFDSFISGQKIVCVKCWIKRIKNSSIHFICKWCDCHGKFTIFIPYIMLRSVVHKKNADVNNSRTTCRIINKITILVTNFDF